MSAAADPAAERWNNCGGAGLMSGWRAWAEIAATEAVAMDIATRQMYRRAFIVAGVAAVVAGLGQHASARRAEFVHHPDPFTPPAVSDPLGIAAALGGPGPSASSIGARVIHNDCTISTPSPALKLAQLDGQRSD